MPVTIRILTIASRHTFVHHRTRREFRRDREVRMIEKTSYKIVRSCGNCNIDPFRRCDHPSGVDGRSPRAQTCPMLLASQRAPSFSVRAASPPFPPPPYPAILSRSPPQSLPLSLSFNSENQKMCSKVRHSRFDDACSTSRKADGTTRFRIDRSRHCTSKLSTLKHAPSHVVVGTC